MSWLRGFQRSENFGKKNTTDAVGSRTGVRTLVLLLFLGTGCCIRQAGNGKLENGPLLKAIGLGVAPELFPFRAVIHLWDAAPEDPPRHNPY